MRRDWSGGCLSGGSSPLSLVLLAQAICAVFFLAGTHCTKAKALITGTVPRLSQPSTRRSRGVQRSQSSSRPSYTTCTYPHLPGAIGLPAILRRAESPSFCPPFQVDLYVFLYSVCLLLKSALSLLPLGHVGSFHFSNRSLMTYAHTDLHVR